MSVFNFTETKASSVQLDPNKLDFNESLINQNCIGMCLFRNKCNPQITTTTDNTVEVIGSNGIIGVNNESGRCFLTQFLLRGDGYFGVDL